MWGQIWGQVGNSHRAKLIPIKALEFKCDSLHRSIFLFTHIHPPVIYIYADFFRDYGARPSMTFLPIW